MRTSSIAMAGAVFGAAFALAPAAWAAQNNTAGGPTTVSVAVPAIEKVLAAPAITKRFDEPARPDEGTAPVQTAQPAQRAGLAKPVKVYWFLGGR